MIKSIKGGKAWPHKHFLFDQPIEALTAPKSLAITLWHGGRAIVAKGDKLTDAEKAVRQFVAVNYDRPINVVDGVMNYQVTEPFGAKPAKLNYSAFLQGVNARTNTEVFIDVYTGRTLSHGPAAKSPSRKRGAMIFRMI